MTRNPILAPITHASKHMFKNSSGRSRGCCRAREARTRELLAAQVPRHVRNPAPVDWRRSAHSAAMARSLRHGIDDAIPEAVAQSADPREGERDFRLVVENDI